MKVKGINKAYSIEVEQGVYVGVEGISIMLNAPNRSLCVCISREDWNKIVKVHKVPVRGNSK